MRTKPRTTVIAWLDSRAARDLFVTAVAEVRTVQSSQANC